MTEKVPQVGSNRLLHSDKKFFKMKKMKKQKNNQMHFQGFASSDV